MSAGSWRHVLIAGSMLGQYAGACCCMWQSPQEADLTHGLVLTALSVLESFGQRGLPRILSRSGLRRLEVCAFAIPLDVAACRRSQANPILMQASPGSRAAALLTAVWGGEAKRVGSCYY